ncbi:hypothetical protein CMQ_1748 [Grosmannia clavigera kw1407]|uniref:Uncharacterized protein n=1 Tax=Grosmannia clavigera (strain kw1407 / UAMH 11150) TaxID=655863 RepID=F0XDP3_GROCL|nr:uncharacterized protein CMQ_1748 [Grosmannia clavigera kw1407]EFX04820.1 hypothetical protein CMQ_1748 [Grosmannia clavigera kw1407]
MPAEASHNIPGQGLARLRQADRLPGNVTRRTKRFLHLVCPVASLRPPAPKGWCSRPTFSSSSDWPLFLFPFSIAPANYEQTTESSNPRPISFRSLLKLASSSTSHPAAHTPPLALPFRDIAGLGHERESAFIRHRISTPPLTYDNREGERLENSSRRSSIIVPSMDGTVLWSSSNTYTV